MRIENVDEKEKEDIGDPSIIQPELSYDELVQKSKDEMNFKQRLGYFWEYHKWKVLIPTAILLFIILFVQGYLKEIQPTDLNIKIVNCQDDALLSDYITSYSDEQVANGMLEYGLNVEGYFVQPEVVDEYTAADNTVATSMQKYQSIVVSGQMDVTIATDWVLKEYGKSDVFMDLSEALPDELYSELKDDLVYTKLESGKEIPVGVYLDNNETICKSFGENRPAVGIFSKTEKKENAVSFLKYILGK